MSADSVYGLETCTLKNLISDHWTFFNHLFMKQFKS